VPTREWEGVFDAWIQGDAQQFAEMLQAEIERELEAKEMVTEKRRRREEAAEKERVALEESEQTKPTIFVKRKASKPLSHSAKRCKVLLPPTPPKSPLPVNGKSNNKHSVKFYVRIPPKPACFSKAKVVISTPAPPRMSSRKGQPPVTPVPSPRLRSPPPKPTKTRRKAERTLRTPRSSKGTTGGVIRKRGLISPPSSTSQTSQDDVHEDIDMDTDILPVSFVRTIQYGLRSSEG